MSANSALDAIVWYVRCLEDVRDGKVVRGLAEAKAGYEAALDRLAAAAELAHAREQLVRQRNHYAVLAETAAAQRDTLAEALRDTAVIGDDDVRAPCWCIFGPVGDAHDAYCAAARSALAAVARTVVDGAAG